MRRIFFTVVILLPLVLVACAASASPPPSLTQPPAIAPTAPSASGGASCSATYPVPGDEFRSDDPKKLDAGNKPKLVEFFAYW